MTTLNSIDDIYRIVYGNTTFHIEVAKNSFDNLSKEQVQQILTHINISQHVKVNITKTFTKVQLSKS